MRHLRAWVWWAGLLAVVLWAPRSLRSSAASPQEAGGRGGGPAPRAVAYVWEFRDDISLRIGATRLLEEAGFDVLPLPLDRSPWELSGLIFIGSFATEHPEYHRYMEEYSDDLVDFVEAGNVLVQMTQSAWTEATPDFLPRSLRARRADEELAHVYVTSPGHPLLAGVPTDDVGRIAPSGRRAVWNGLAMQSGFEVILAADRFAQQPALMEAPFGKGRFILSAMPFDKVMLLLPELEQDPAVQPSSAPVTMPATAPTTTPATAPTTAPASVPTTAPVEPNPPFKLDWDGFNRAFFANLREYVLAVRGGSARLPQATSWRPGGGYVQGSWVLGVIPDTQIYALRFPGLFELQTDWLARSAARLDIRFAVHLGDITDRNSPAEWDHARQAMSRLDGVIPYAIVPGNHDYGPNGNATTRDTLLNRFFVFRDFSSRPEFGGAMQMGRLDNTYHLFEAGQRKWVVLALEWGPRESTIEWANSVMSRYADRVGILITHAYMNNNNRRYDHTDDEHTQNWNPHNYRTPGGVNDGEELWQKLVRKHNFALVLNGHVLGDGTGYLASQNDTGTITHQMLSNYQMRQMGGEGYLRLIEFLPDGHTLRVRTYSPVYEKFLLDPDQHFEMRLTQPMPITSTPR